MNSSHTGTSFKYEVDDYESNKDLTMFDSSSSDEEEDDKSSYPDDCYHHIEKVNTQVFKYMNSVYVCY
jgi:hypothetical protein